MKVIVGLGNPGNRYKFTRHNIGFWVIDEIARRRKIKLNRKKFFCYAAQIKINEEDSFLFKPLTYMNLSGRAVIKIKQELNVCLEDLLVISDDANLDAGKIRFRASGSAGGHNGLNSIIEALQTLNFPRLKIGIGKPQEDDRLEEYVLQEIDKKTQSSYSTIIAEAAEAVFFWAAEGISSAMNRYNTKI